MKCPYCGAETQNDVCEFCGSEIPKDKSTVNITNNYYGNNTSTGKCPKCGADKVTFKREKIGTATQSRNRKNTFTSGSKGHAVSQNAYRTVGICQNCGYTWDPNVATGAVKKSSSKTWLWVLGWICIFPIPLTILMLRKKDMKPAVKYGIIVAAWIVYFIIAAAGRNNDNSTTQKETQIEQTAESIENTAKTDTTTETEQVETAQDEKVDTGAFSDAVGKAYKLGDNSVDIIASETFFS